MSGNLKDRGVFNMSRIVTAFIAFFVLMTGVSADAGTDAMVEKATIERIKPFGEVNIGAVPVAAAPTGGDAKGTYTASCAACHGTGAAGAPKVGDKGAWKARIGQGIATLVKNAINGKGAMPPRGGTSLGDDEIEAVVKYMVKSSK